MNDENKKQFTLLNTMGRTGDGGPVGEIMSHHESLESAIKSRKSLRQFGYTSMAIVELKNPDCGIKRKCGRRWRIIVSGEDVVRYYDEN